MLIFDTMHSPIYQTNIGHHQCCAGIIFLINQLVRILTPSGSRQNILIKCQVYMGDTMELYNGTCANTKCLSTSVSTYVIPAKLDFSYPYTLIDTQVKPT